MRHLPHRTDACPPRPASWHLIPRLLLIVAIAVAAVPPAAAAEGTYWLSDAPPGSEWAKKLRRSHGGPVERGRRGVYVKRLWLRTGNDPRGAGYATFDGPRAWVQGPDGEARAIEPFRADAGAGLRFEMPEEGFYNAFLVEQGVREGVLRTSVQKAEILKHSCGEGHDPAFIHSRMPPRTTGEVPFEVVRERLPDEDFHTRVRSGDRLTFRVLAEGRPAAGATVELVSDNGWHKRVTADHEGRATFELVQDYHPEWTEFEKRHRQGYLVLAEYRTDASGSRQGTAYHSTAYRASLSGSYFPAERAYMSYLYGLGVMLLALLAGTGLVYHFRLRQRRPGPREDLDEKA